LWRKFVTDLTLKIAAFENYGCDKLILAKRSIGNTRIGDISIGDTFIADNSICNTFIGDSSTGVTKSYIATHNKHF
jgi:hypothetical protein